MGENKVTRIVFLCSGGGGNLFFIKKIIELGLLDRCEVVAVFSDRICQANSIAGNLSIVNKCLDFKQNGQELLLIELQRINPDIIITTVHKVLGEKIVSAFQGRLINLHYSLLPSFNGQIGINPVKSAIGYGALFTGVTVHFVDLNLDMGKPIVQVAISLGLNESDFDSLMNVVFRSGCIALMISIKNIILDTFSSAPLFVEIMGRSCLFSDVFDDQFLLNNHKFWNEISYATKVV